LSGEVSNNVDSVTPPQRQNTFLFDATSKAVHDTCVLSLEFVVLIGCLKQQFDSFNGGCEGLSRYARYSSCKEVEELEVVWTNWSWLRECAIGHPEI